MYLPIMPRIAADLGGTEGAMQLSLMSFFAGLMIGQLVFGPLSDRLGRKRMIHAGMLLFVLASLGCALAQTMDQFVGWRFVQGLGGSIGMVIGLAMVRDLYSGRTAASLVALMMIVQGVAPVLAPALGAGLTAIAPWSMLFVVLAVFGSLCMALTAIVLPETRSPELRLASRPSEALRNYLRLIGSRQYFPFAAACALAMGGFFAYLAGSSFVYISVHGVSPAMYSLIFACNALGLMAGAQLAPRLLRRWHAASIVRGALGVYVAAALLLVALEWSGHASVLSLSALLFVVITAMAFVLPLGSVMALEAFGDISGTAAALLGAMNFGAGALAALVVAATANGTRLPMAVVIAASGLMACLVAFLAFPRRRSAVAREVMA